MAIALIGSGVSAGDTGTGGGGPYTTGTYDTTGATLLVAAHTRNTGAGSWPAFTDSKGNTWTDLTPQIQIVNVRFHYVINPTAGSGHTFTSGFLASSASSMAILAFSGTGAYGSENGAIQGFGTSLSTGSVTPGANGALIVAALGWAETVVASVAINASLTIQQQVAYSGSDHTGIAIAYYIQPTAGAINPQWSWTGNSEAAATIATFAAGAGAPDLTVTVNEPTPSVSIF